MDQIEVCYLLLSPYHTSDVHNNSIVNPSIKDTPYFFDLDISFSSLGVQNIEIANTAVEVELQLLDSQVLVHQCKFTFKDPFSSDATLRFQSFRDSIKKAVFSSGEPKLFEEHFVLLIENQTSKPSEFVQKNKFKLARLLRSFEKRLDKEETESILATHVHYSESDTTIVDWEGSLIITQDGDYQSDVELLKIGNYQLLRYRILDSQLDKNLNVLRTYSNKKRSWFPRENKIAQEIVNQRLDLILNFEKINESLLLIGDWYSAKLYRSIVEEFYIDDWKRIVGDKLESLGSIHEVVTQNLTFSWSRLLDMVQIAGWLILLIGYFVLFFIDLYQAK